MKFAVVLALALSLVAVSTAYMCGDCNLDGKWRTVNTGVLHADDDDIIAQLIDGQVEFREEFQEFQDDLADFFANPTQSLRDVARQSCKEAIPDRVYNFRFEREIDGDDYELNLYLYAGYKISERNWDKYCTELMSTDYDGNSALLFVPTKGESSIATLKGAWQRRATGTMTYEGGNNCNARFRAREINQACMMKNDGNRFPTEVFCGVSSGTGAITTITDKHAFGGAHTHARYGCQQYTWDSDTNDDNIKGDSCNQLYFVNSYAGSDSFKLGVLPAAATGTVYLNQLVTVDTPFGLCERSVGATGWNDLTKPQSHPCQ